MSNCPVVFGDITGDDWHTICHAQPVEICDPSVPTGPLTRCPFTGDPNLCHSSNPDWPQMEEINTLLEIEEYSVPPFGGIVGNSFRARSDFRIVTDIKQCREDVYCTCFPGGVQCKDIPEQIMQMPGFAASVSVHSLVSLKKTK